MRNICNSCDGVLLWNEPIEIVNNRMYCLECYEALEGDSSS